MKCPKPSCNGTLVARHEGDICVWLECHTCWDMQSAVKDACYKRYHEIPNDGQEEGD